MLSKNILPSNRKRSILAVLIIINMVLYAFGACINNNAYAAQTKENYSTKINNYPGYAELIQALKTKYPNWNFTMLYTGLDWNEVIKNETVAYHGRSLVSANKSTYWFCETCGGKAYDNGSWKCASEAAVGYYMDPRNWLNEDYIFQFEDLSYNGNIQNVDGVKQILNGTWMSGDTILYVDTNGNTQTINKSYAQVIMESSATAGISPYHLAARIRQEQGINYASSTGSGKYEGYVGYYNLLNIKASGSGSATIIRNALTHAQSKGWTDPEKSILGGAQFIAAEYINRGQSTLFLQKYDVDSSDGALYYHQYMQNIEAAKSEGSSVKNSYANMGLLNSSINFVIPVFENMPTEASGVPGSQFVVTQNVVLNGIDVAIRDGRGTSTNVITRVSTGESLIRIELATSMVDGYYWDKVVLSNGTKGYIARTFINQVADITNANDSAVTNTGVNLRNGPGTSGTSVIIMLSKGQAVTVMETGKYNGVDGYNWSRVKLANGTQGYLVSDYINIVTNGSDATGNTLAILNGNGVRLRTGIGTSYGIVTSLNTGDLVTIIQRNAGTANGFTWDKVVTSSGLEGYIANTYLTLQNNQTQPKPPEPTPVTPTPSENTIITNNNFKADGANVICVPNTTVSNIKSSNSTAVITRNGNTMGDSELVGTGCVITIGNSKYTVVKKGDVNGDGQIKATDYMKIKNYIMGSTSLSDSEKTAADTNNDNLVKATDYMKIKNHIMGTSLISL